MRVLFTITLCISLIALTGCVDRETADKKLVVGCKAGIEAFLPEGHSIESVDRENFKNLKAQGPGYRQVTLDIKVYDGFFSLEQTHSCVFLEQFSFGKLAHNASIYQLDSNGRIIGYKDGAIVGGFEENQKLAAAVEAAM